MAAQRETPFATDSARFDAGRLGMWIFLAALAALFAATLVGFAYVRWIAERDAPWTSVHLPKLLWVSTAMLMLSAISMELARQPGPAAARVRWLLITLGLGTGFLLCQALAWWQLASAGIIIQTDLSAWSFYIFTATHGAHVLGGLLALSLTLRRALREGDSPRVRRATSYCAIYWHFLEVVWVVLFAVLLVAG